VAEIIGGKDEKAFVSHTFSLINFIEIAKLLSLKTRLQTRRYRIKFEKFSSNL
jgi:hypothetical protein